MDHFRWVLEHFKGFLFDDQVSLTFVMDREQALINTVEIVFPNTAYLLCRWDIAIMINKKCKAVLPKVGNGEKNDMLRKIKPNKAEIVPNVGYYCLLFNCE